MDVKEIAEILNKYPDLKQRLKEMIDIVEGPKHGEFSTIDAIEERAVDVVRETGRDLMHNWAAQQASHAGFQIQERVASAKKNTKKKFTGTQPLEKLK